MNSNTLSKLLGFVYTIDYRLGKQNMAADALSRRDDDEGSLNLKTLIKLKTGLYDIHSKDSHNGSNKTGKWDKPWTCCNPPTNVARYTSRPCKNGILCNKGKIKLCSSSTLRNDHTKEFHGTPLDGHVGMHKMFLRLLATSFLFFFWPGWKRM